MSIDPEQAKRFSEAVEKALAEITAARAPKFFEGALENVKQALVPNMFTGMTAKLAREAKMDGIPPEVPGFLSCGPSTGAAWKCHGGMTSDVVMGEDGKINIKLTFANPRWIYTTEKTAP